MSNDALEDIVFMMVRIGLIVVIVFNAGIAVIMLRQISVMNSVIKVAHGGLMSLIMLIFLIACFVILFYIVLN